MRLIEIAACHRNVCPIGRGTASRQVNGALKTLHPTELLRCDADLIGEYLDKMPLAQPELRGKVASPRFACLSTKDVERGPNCSMFVRRVLQTSEQGLFQNAKTPGWIPSRTELLTQLLRRSSPKHFQIHMNIGEFTCRNAQETKRTARLEMHTDDVPSRINEQRLRIRPRKECA